MAAAPAGPVGLDATPLLGPRTGIGVYVEHLLAGLAARADPAVVATAFTLRGAARLRTTVAALAPGAAVHVRPAPARLLRQAWLRTDVPTVRALAGRVELFHGTNFVLPPLGGARGVVTVHDLSYDRFPDTVSRESLDYQRLVPRSLERAHAVCVPSAAVAAEVVEHYGLPAERVVVTPLGVDPSWAAVGDALAAGTADPPPAGTPTGPYLLAVGTLEPRKDLVTLVRAHARLWHTGTHVPLLLTGPAGWGPALRLDDVPEGSVRLLGFRPRAELQRLVAGAAGLAFPSLYEGFGLPPLEALAAGTPVVASDLPVTREVLADHARFAPAGDVDAWTQALARVLADPPGTAAIAAARAHAAEFTWSRTVDATLTAYALARG